MQSLFETWLQMPCKIAVISSYPFQGTAPCPLKPGSGPPRQGVPGNCLSSFLIHPPLNRSYYLCILSQKALRAGRNCCTYSVRVLQLEKVLSPALGYARSVLEWETLTVLFPRQGRLGQTSVLHEPAESASCIMACSLQYLQQSP